MDVQWVRRKDTHPDRTGALAQMEALLCSQLTVVFIMPVPWVRMELAMWRMLMVFRCLLLDVRSTNIYTHTQKININDIFIKTTQWRHKIRHQKQDDKSSHHKHEMKSNKIRTATSHPTQKASPTRLYLPSWRSSGESQDASEEPALMEAKARS